LQKSYIWRGISRKKQEQGKGLRLVHLELAFHKLEIAVDEREAAPPHHMIHLYGWERNGCVVRESHLWC
jgi:hypothetical protein